MTCLVTSEELPVDRLSGVKCLVTPEELPVDRLSGVTFLVTPEELPVDRLGGVTCLVTPEEVLGLPMPNSGKARQSGFLTLWTHGSTAVLRSLFTTVPLVFLQLDEEDFLGALASFSSSIRPVSGFMIVGDKDPKWLVFAVSQLLGAGGDAISAGIQIYQAVTGATRSACPASIWPAPN